jgi:hypothetical protein
MKKTLVNLFGSIFAWLCGLFTLLATLEGCLTIFAVYMMEFDHGLPVEDHDWNATVVIHTFDFIVLSAIALLCMMLARSLLKDEWWRMPIRQVRTIGGFLCRR